MSDASRDRENHRGEVKAAHLEVRATGPCCANCKHWVNAKPMPGTLERIGQCIEGPPVALVVPNFDPKTGQFITQITWTPPNSMSKYHCGRHKPELSAGPSMPLQ